MWKNAIKPDDNLAVRIYLIKKEIYGPKSLNNKCFKVLPVSDLDKPSAILMVTIKKCYLTKKVNKRDFVAYNICVWFTNKVFDKKFVDYLGLVFCP